MKCKLFRDSISLLALVFLLVPVLFVSAEEAAESKEPAAAYHYALSQCEKLGILEGDEGGLRPEAAITRAESVAAILRVSSLEEAAQANRGYTGFGDVDPVHWASGYINTATIRGIVNGKPDGTFAPSETVTRFQMVKMIVCALGYGEKVTKMGGTYPEAYLAYAVKLGLLKQIPTADETLTRGDAAQLLYDALFVIPLDANGSELEPYAEGFGVVGKQEDPETKSGHTYYLSPEGDDHADGSETAPWKSLAAAAMKLSAGDTLVLEDGEHRESELVRFAAGGREDAPITITARNRHMAKIIFGPEVKDAQKIYAAYGQNYIIIQNLEITQEEIGTITNDILVDLRGDYCAVLNNKIHHCYEEPVKSHKSKGFRVIGNELYDSVHEGIDVVNVEDAVFAGNHISDCGRVFIMAKGGSRNVKIYNNWIDCDKQIDIRVPSMGIGLGGSTDNTSGLGNKRGDYEAYNFVAWNNVVNCTSPGLLLSGINFCGAKDTIAFNNVVYGAQAGIAYTNPADTKNGWGWDPENRNVSAYNNIVMNCTEAAVRVSGRSTNMLSDYNLYYKTANAPIETHSIYSDPRFMDAAGGDFRLKEDSPARESGKTIVPEWVGYDGTPFYFDVKDYAGNERTGKWSMGAYVFGAISKNAVETGSATGRLLTDYFDYTAFDNWEIISGVWECSEGALRGNNPQAKGVVRYAEGQKWTDYTFEADVSVTDASDRDRCSGLLFRSDIGGNNMYFFRFKQNFALEFGMWKNGVFASLQTWEYESEPYEFYNMRVDAVGDSFTFYVNGEKIGEAKDESFPRGTVGFYSYWGDQSFDNALVTAISE